MKFKVGDTVKVVAYGGDADDIEIGVMGKILDEPNGPDDLFYEVSLDNKTQNWFLEEELELVSGDNETEVQVS